MHKTRQTGDKQILMNPVKIGQNQTNQAKKRPFLSKNWQNWAKKGANKTEPWQSRKNQKYIGLLMTN